MVIQHLVGGFGRKCFQTSAMLHVCKIFKALKKLHANALQSLTLMSKGLDINYVLHNNNFGIYILRIPHGFLLSHVVFCLRLTLFDK